MKRKTIPAETGNRTILNCCAFHKGAKGSTANVAVVDIFCKKCDCKKSLIG